MRNSIAWVLKLGCLALLVVLVLNAAQLANAEDPIEELANVRRTSVEAAQEFLAEPTPEAEDLEAKTPDPPSPDPQTPEAPAAEPAKKPGTGESTADPKAAKAVAKKPATSSDKPKPLDAPEVYDPIFAKFLFDKKPPKKVKPIVLEGIGGGYAFLTAPTGKSGLAAVGETFQGIKVLKIAQNRVLVEYKGEQKEISIWNGLGSDPLIAKSTKAATPKTDSPKNDSRKTPSPKPAGRGSK